MIKRIIVEGADQQGKSTLCRLLSTKLGWPIKHFGKPDENFNFIEDYIVPENTISDRNFLSEVVYSKINNRKSRAQFMLLDNIFKNKDTLLILLDREDDFVFDNNRHEDYSLEAIQQAILIYRQAFDLLSMEKLSINPNSQDSMAQIEEIYENIQNPGV